MSTTPRIPTDLAAGFTMLGYGGDTPAARIAIPAELTRLAGIPIASDGSLQIDPLVHECIRLYNAKVQGCQYCMNARAAGAVQAGLNEDMVSQLRDFERSTLPDNVKAALRITAAVASAPQLVTPALLDAARVHFSEQEVIDIVLLCTRPRARLRSRSASIQGARRRRGCSTHQRRCTAIRRNSSVQSRPWPRAV